MVRGGEVDYHQGRGNVVFHEHLLKTCGPFTAVPGVHIPELFVGSFWHVTGYHNAQVCIASPLAGDVGGSLC